MKDYLCIEVINYLEGYAEACIDQLYEGRTTVV